MPFQPLFGGKNLRPPCSRNFSRGVCGLMLFFIYWNAWFSPLFTDYIDSGGFCQSNFRTHPVKILPSKPKERAKAPAFHPFFSISIWQSHCYCLSVITVILRSSPIFHTHGFIIIIFTANRNIIIRGSVCIRPHSPAWHC